MERFGVEVTGVTAAPEDRGFLRSQLLFTATFSAVEDSAELPYLM
jgi:hypothetical protein